MYETVRLYDRSVFPDLWRIRIVQTEAFVRRSGVTPTYGGALSPSVELLDRVREARRRASDRVRCERRGSVDMEAAAALTQLYASEYVLRAFRESGENVIRYSDIESRTRPSGVADSGAVCSG